MRPPIKYCNRSRIVWNHRKYTQVKYIDKKQVDLYSVEDREKRGGKMKKTEIKTNAMRILERNKVPYEAIQYECDEFIDGLHTAQITGAPVEQSFKTLVVQGKSKEYYVLVIPIAEEINLKTAAKAVGEKSVEMIHVKDINKVTGYVRGGCSPLGMKKLYPTVIHESALNFSEIYISGGKIGITLKVNPEKLAEVVKGEFHNIIA